MSDQCCNGGSESVRAHRAVHRLRPAQCRRWCAEDVVDFNGNSLVVYVGKATRQAKILTASDRAELMPTLRTDERLTPTTLSTTIGATRRK